MPLAHHLGVSETLKRPGQVAQLELLQHVFSRCVSRLQLLVLKTL